VINRDGVLQLQNPSNLPVRVRVVDLLGKELRTKLLPAGGSIAWSWSELGTRMLFVVTRGELSGTGVQRGVGTLAK